MAELVNMSDQFKGLPMGSLIGGPLTAACDAQIRLANATADFIKMVGFEPEIDPSTKQLTGNVIPRTADFKFKRPVEIPDKTDTSQLALGTPQKPIELYEEEVELQVPLLAIVKVPNLSITTVDVTFDMEVKSSFSSTSSTDAEASMKAGGSINYLFYSAKVEIHGKVSSHKENTRTSDNSAKYHVAVHAEDKGMPEGLSRVMDILQTSIAPRKIAAAVKVP